MKHGTRLIPRGLIWIAEEKVILGNPNLWRYRRIDS